MKTADQFIAYCRTPRGQMRLIAFAYVGAVVTACIVLGMRSRFAATVYERFPTEDQQPNAAELQQLAEDIDDGKRTQESIENLTASELIVVYGVLIDDHSADVEGPLAEALWEQQAEQTLIRIRRTLVAGNQRQRLRALRLLGTMPAMNPLDEAAHLCRYALRRATRCRDDSVAAEARSVLSKLERR